MKTLIIIPSRLSATRLPGKPLLKINGLSMISHVFKKAEEENILGIKGHRSVGGVRISLYNAINEEMIDYLNKFISRFFENKK